MRARFDWQQLAPSADQPTALYRQLAKNLTEAIGQGLLQPGDYLLPERELASLLALSRVTVRKAYQLLLHKGLVSSRQGDGTRVGSDQDKPIQKALSVLSSFSEDMLKRGLTPSDRPLNHELGQATPKEALMLGLAPQARVGRLTRVRLADNKPMAFEIAALPAVLLPADWHQRHSLYAMLAEQGQRPLQALQTMTAINADAQTARHLQIEVGDALLYIERQSFNQHGQTIEFTRSYYRGDRYDFVTQIISGSTSQEEL